MSAPVSRIRSAALRRPFHLNQKFCQRCRHERDRDLLSHQPVPQRFHLLPHCIFGDVHARACRQVRPHLPHRRIKSNRSQEAGAIERFHFESPQMPATRLASAPRGSPRLSAARSTPRCRSHRQVIRAGRSINTRAGIAADDLPIGVQVRPRSTIPSPVIPSSVSPTSLRRVITADRPESRSMNARRSAGVAGSSGNIPRPPSARPATLSPTPANAPAEFLPAYPRLPQGAQMLGQLIRPAFQLRIAEAFPASLHGQRIRRCSRMFGHEAGYRKRL